MAASPLSAFESALADLDVSTTCVSPEEFPAAVDDVLEAPSVGVENGAVFDDGGVSLADTAVEVDPTPATLQAATTGVTAARFGVADYGSVVLTPTDDGSELVSLFVDHHVVVVRERDVLADMDAAIESIGDEFDRTGGSAILATGPSATADMGALVKGAHGPSDVTVLVVTERE